MLLGFPSEVPGSSFSRTPFWSGFRLINKVYHIIPLFKLGNLNMKDKDKDKKYNMDDSEVS